MSPNRSPCDALPQRRVRNTRLLYGLFHNRGQTGHNIAHDVLGHRVDVPNLARDHVQLAGPVTANHAIRSGARTPQRHRKSRLSGERPTDGDSTGARGKKVSIDRSSHRVHSSQPGRLNTGPRIMLINMHQARSRLSRLIAAAEAGDDVVIARRGKPAVRPVPVKRTGFRFGGLAHLGASVADFDEALEEQEPALWEGAP